MRYEAQLLPEHVCPYDDPEEVANRVPAYGVVDTLTGELVVEEGFYVFFQTEEEEVNRDLAIAKAKELNELGD